MPKLASKEVKKVNDAEVPESGFTAWPNGKYIATLAEVETRFSQAGNEMWNVVFEDCTDLDGEEMPGKQFTNLVLPGDDKKIPEDYKMSPSAEKRKLSREEAWKSRNEFLRGKIKEFFLAFGYSPDSDTDEMIGERCVIKVSQTTIQQGKRKGETGNQVDAFDTLDSVDFEDAAAKDDEDTF
jgi:hypothetical protein